MAKLEFDATTDFSRGQIDDVALTRFPPNAAALILNGRIQSDGTLERRDGTKRTHPTTLNASATGYGGYRFTSAAGTEQLVVFCGAKAFMSDDRGVTWAEEASGLRQDFYSFATMRVGASNYLFAANGDTTIKRWNGTTWDTLPNAPSGVKYIAVFNGRLWAFGHSGLIGQASKINDPATWTSPDGITLTIQVHGGDVLTGAHQIGPHLLVFSRYTTSYIDGFGEQTIVVATGATGFSASVGCVAFRSIASVGDNACCWLSDRGVEYYSPSTGIRLLSSNLRTFLESIDLEQLKANPGRPSAAYDTVEEQYHLALSTSGTRNNRTLVFDLSHRGRDWLGAPSVDRQVSATGEIFFTAGSDGYLGTGSGGFETKSDADGYMTLVTQGQGGDPTVEDASGYLDTSTNDTLPATLFTAPTATHPAAIHSVGYDGFVRVHKGVDNDDVASTGTGGSEISMSVVSRPFYFRSPRNRKRVREIHLAVMSDAGATISVGVRAGGNLTALQTVTFAASALDQPKRKRKMISAIGDAPQVEMHMASRARVAMLGLSAEVMREL